MKKAQRLAALLMAMAMVLGTFASGSAAGFTFPADLIEIEDEAFAGSGFEGLVELPEGVKKVGSDVFADSDVFALSVPASVETLGDQSSQDLAYVYFQGSDTKIEGEVNARYVFAEEGSAAEKWADKIGAEFVNKDSVVEHAGFYYQVDDGEALLLCAEDSTAVPEHVTIPSEVGDATVMALSPDSFVGCDHVSTINVLGGTAELDGCFEGAPSADVNRYQEEPKMTITTVGSVLVGSTRQLEYTFEDGYYTGVEYSTSNKYVLTIDRNGLMTGVNSGSAVVTITTPAGQTAQQTIWVAKDQNAVIGMQLASDSFVPAWFCQIPVLLKNTNMGYVASAQPIPCTAEFLDAQGNVILTQENAASVQTPLANEAEGSIVFENQLWAKAYQAGAKKVRVSLSPSAESGVQADQNSTVIIKMPDSHPYPVVAFEYTASVRPNSYVDIRATCINSSTLTEQRQITVCDPAGKLLGSCYISAANPSGVISVYIPADAKEGQSFLVSYPAPDSAASACSDRLTIGVSIFTGVAGAQESATTPIKIGVGEDRTLACTYTGDIPQLTCTSWDPTIAYARVEGDSLIIIGAAQGNTAIEVTDGYQTSVVYITVEAGKITEFSQIDYMLLYIGETGSMMFSYTGNPQITCTSYNENVATVERDGNFIRVTGVAAGQTTIAVSDGSGSYYYVTVNVSIDPNGPPVLLGFNGGLDVNMTVKEIVPLWIQCSNSNVAPAGLTYTSSNENVVKVLNQEKWSVSILGLNPGTAQLTASDGQNSFTINVNVTAQTPQDPPDLPELYLDMDSDGQMLDMALPYVIKVRTSTPADQFVMPSVILADWEFLAADGSVVYTTSVPHNPLDEPVLEDNTITLSLHFGTMIYQIGASTARVKLGQSPTMFSEYIVSQPEQYLTFHIPDINTAYVTVFSVNSDAPTVENRTVLVENGTNVTLTLECLNPWLLKGDTRSVFWEKNGEEKTKLGEVSQAAPSLTFAVPALQDELVRYKFMIEWPPYWPAGGYDSCEIEIQYGDPFEYEYGYEPFDLNDMAVDVGKTAAVPVYNQNFSRPQDLSWTIEDENIAIVEDGIVTGIAPGETTLTVCYGPIVRTAKVRVYASDKLQTGELSLAQDQSVWPWVQQDLFTTPWRVKIKAGQSAELLGAAPRIYLSIAFTDAQDNVVQTYNTSTETRFHLPNETTGDVYLDTLMLNKLAAAGVVKATVRIEAVTGGLTINGQGRSVDIFMDSLYNYPDDGMLYIEHSNPYEVKLGDKLTFTVKAGNRTVNKDCTLLLGYSGQHYTTGDFFDEVLVPVTFNPSQIGEQTVTFETNQYAGYHLRVGFYNHDRSFQLGDYSAVVSAN